MKVEPTGLTGEPQLLTTGIDGRPFRQGSYAEQIIANLHPKYFELVRSGRIFRQGATATALSANSISLTATTTPIIGLWNPVNSGVVLVPLRVVMLVTAFGNSAVAPGGFVWAKSSNNSALTLGLTGINSKTWASNSTGRAFTLATALTGLTNNLVIERGSSLSGPIATQPATAAVAVAQAQEENLDGLDFIPEGGLQCLLNITSTTTCSVAVGIHWAEFPKAILD